MPLAELTNQRVTNLYDLMDAAYDSEIIREKSRSLGHVPLIDINPRNNKKLKAEKKRFKIINFKRSEDVRYNERSSAERVNARLKDADYNGFRGAYNLLTLKNDAIVKSHFFKNGT